MKVEDLKGLHKIIYDMIAASMGKRNIKFMDIKKAMKEKHPDLVGQVQMAVKDLVDWGLLVYEYRGGSYLVIPHEDPAAKRI